MGLGSNGAPKAPAKVTAGGMLCDQAFAQKGIFKTVITVHGASHLKRAHVCIFQCEAIR